MVKNNKQSELEQQIGELTQDLQRVRADFENYRKRVEVEKQSARNYGQIEMVQKLLPVIDDIERAIANIPADLAENAWVQGVANLDRNLVKTLESIGVQRIVSTPGTAFDPDLHHAVQFDEGSTGNQEIIAEN